MHFSEYQLEAVKTAVYPGQGTKAGLEYCLFGWVGEVGEFFNKYKKVIRDSNGELTTEIIESLLDEFGDAGWYSAMICTELKASLDKVYERNLTKLFSRKAKGTLRGSGDFR